MKHVLIDYLNVLWATKDVVDSLRYGDADLITNDEKLLGRIGILSDNIDRHIELSEQMSNVLSSGLEVMQSIYNNQLQSLNNRFALVTAYLTVLGTAFLVPNTIATIAGSGLMEGTMASAVVVLPTACYFHDCRDADFFPLGAPRLEDEGRGLSGSGMSGPFFLFFCPLFFCDSIFCSGIFPAGILCTSDFRDDDVGPGICLHGYFFANFIRSRFFQFGFEPFSDTLPDNPQSPITIKKYCTDQGFKRVCKDRLFPTLPEIL